MKRLIAILTVCLALCVSSLQADVTQEQVGGRLIVTIVGTGVTVDDTANMTTAVNLVNANANPSTIRIVGDISLSSTYTFTAPVSMEGATGYSTITYTGTSSSAIFRWAAGGGYDPFSDTAYDATTPHAFSERIDVPGQTFTEGQWIIIWDNSQIDGVSPHLGEGEGQHPMEMHQVSYFDNVNKEIYVDGFVVDEITSNAAGKIAVLDNPLQDISLSRLVFDYDESGTPPDYAQALRFEGCVGIDIDKVRFTRRGYGTIWFDFCADIDCDIIQDGTDKVDRVYGVVAGVVNGMLLEGIWRNTRHPFTTTAGNSVDVTDTVSSVDTGADTVTATAHGLSNADCISFTTTGTLPNPLQALTPYWVVSSTTNTIQVAATPGGSALNITTTGSGTHTIKNSGRWGTPLNITVKGTQTLGTKFDNSSGTVSSRTGFSTHPEGWGIVFNVTVYTSGESANWAAFARARNTIFKNCTFNAGYTSASSGNAKGVYLAASDCKVVSSTFDKFWIPIQLDYSANDRTVQDQISDNVLIANNQFISCRAPVTIKAGNNVQILNNNFVESGISSGGSPFYRNSLIQLIPDANGDLTSVVISNNNLQKGTAGNLYSLETQIAASQVKFTGNNVTGYGSGDLGIGWTDGIDSIQTAADTLTITAKHGFQDGATVRFTTTGTLPNPLATGTTYYVIDSSDTTFQVETTPGGGAINITDVGSGTHTVISEGAALLPTTYANQNWKD